MKRAAISQPSAGTRQARVKRTWPRLAEMDPNGRNTGCLRSVGDSLLCILAEGSVNMAALRMAANLVARRIGDAVARLEAEPPPVRPPSPPSPSDAAPSPRRAVEAPPGMRRFRGSTVG